MVQNITSYGKFKVFSTVDAGQKPCARRRCEGKVRPLGVPNVGCCDHCGERTAWWFRLPFKRPTGSSLQTVQAG